MARRMKRSRGLSGSAPQHRHEAEHFEDIALNSFDEAKRMAQTLDCEGALDTFVSASVEHGLAEENFRWAGVGARGTKKMDKVLAKKEQAARSFEKNCLIKRRA